MLYFIIFFSLFKKRAVDLLAESPADDLLAGSGTRGDCGEYWEGSGESLWRPHLQRKTTHL